MLRPESALEKNQLQKLIQCVLTDKIEDIKKLINKGVPNILNYNEPNEGKTALIKAIELNNERLVTDLILLGADPELPDENGKTPLMYACEFGLHIIVEDLCKLGVNLNNIDKNLNSALSYCIVSATKRHLRCADLLISSGVNVDLQTSGGCAFLEACEKNKEIIALLLFKNGAKLDVCDKNSKNQAIHYAVLNGMIDLCYVLLLNKIDPNALNNELQTPVIFAAKSGNLKILKLLHALGADFDVVDQHGFNPIHYAVARKNRDLVKYLASRGTNPNFKNSGKLTPKLLAKHVKLRRRKKLFSIATKKYDEWKSKFMLTDKKPLALNENSFSMGSIKEMLSWLLRLHDFIDSQKERLETLFSENAHIEYNDSITRETLINILRKYMSPKIPDNFFTELFKILVKDPNSDLIKISSVLKCEGFEKILNMNLQTKKKRKKRKLKLKIHRIRKTRVRIWIPVKKLMKPYKNQDDALQFQKIRFPCNDADFLKYDRNFKNILEDDSRWYTDCSNITTVELANLVDSGNIESYVDLLQRQKNPEAVKKLVNLKDRYYKSPLAIATLKDNLNLVKILLNYQADVNSTDNFKWTPLHHAAFIGNTEIALELIKHGASVNARSITGITPLMVALKANNEKMVKFLLNNKAKLIDPVNLHQDTPIDIAQTFAYQTELFDMIEQKSQKQQNNRIPFVNKTFGRHVVLKKNDLLRKLKPVKVSYVKHKFKLIRPNNLPKPRNKIKSNSANIKLPIQMAKILNDKMVTDTLAKNREIYSWQFDFPNYKTPFDKNIERIKQTGHIRVPRKKVKKRK